MSKRLIFFLLLLYFPHAFTYCPFCDPEVIQKHMVGQDELGLVLYTHKPMTEGHTLIIPKRHIERFEELTEEEMISIYHLIKRIDAAASKTLGTKSYLLLQKNGKEVGQTVPH